MHLMLVDHLHHQHQLQDQLHHQLQHPLHLQHNLEIMIIVHPKTNVEKMRVIVIMIMSAIQVKFICIYQLYYSYDELDTCTFKNSISLFTFTINL